MQKSIGVAKRILPPYIVPSQLKILMPVGTATRTSRWQRRCCAIEVMPDCEHVVRPDARG